VLGSNYFLDQMSTSRAMLLLRPNPWPSALELRFSNPATHPHAPKRVLRILTIRCQYTQNGTQKKNLTWLPKDTTFRLPNLPLQHSRIDCYFCAPYNEKIPHWRIIPTSAT
jgi:hypothetical protein